MILYDKALNPDNWELFYEDYAENEHVYKSDVKKLRSYIDEKRYLVILKEYEGSHSFPIPKLKMLNKKGTGRKRAVFSFDEDSSWLLKFFGYQLHDFDSTFSENLYSFIRKKSVKTAVGRLLKQRNITSMYGVKLDIHDYFNSADTDIILKKLWHVLKDDEKLYGLFENILKNPYIFDEDSQKPECSPIHKGMMAGSPLSPFMANLYLDEVDRHFDVLPGFYARYSDDVIIFMDTEERLRQEMEYFLSMLAGIGLTLNKEKLAYIRPGEAFEFLGFMFEGNEVDVSRSSFEKIKKKLRRKSRAVLRWKIKKKAESEKAAKVFIRYFNRKFFDNPIKSELTWCKWYFPVISRDTTLRQIDHYMQECIRYIYTGKHSKRNYNLRYDEIKKMGYRSLVNEFHSSK